MSTILVLRCLISGNIFLVSIRHVLTGKITPPHNNNHLDNNYVKCHPNLSHSWKVTAWTNDTPFGHGKQLCEISSRSNMAVRSYGPNTDFGYTSKCIRTLTLEMWPWVKFITHHWVMNNNCVKLRTYGPDTDFGYVCKVNLTSRYRYDLGSRSWTRTLVLGIL